MFKKILISSIYTLSVILIFIIFLPWFFINLNALLTLPIISFPLQKPLGAIFFLIGAGNYLYCHKYFFLANRTPLITESSYKLIKTGVYKYSRNPIYLGHLILLLGIFSFFGHLLLLIYALTIFFLLNILVIYYEEPRLKKSLGQEYENYLQKTPRWL